MNSKPPRRVIPIKVELRCALTGEQEAAVRAACGRLQSPPRVLLQILHAVQEALGHVPRDAVPLIARELNLSVAEVHGVLSFYHCFRQQPAGQFKVLRYTNTIDFVNADSARANSKRREIVWFAPDVGRWAASESNGLYYLDDSVVDQPFLEAATAGNCWDGPSLLAAARALRLERVHPFAARSINSGDSQWTD